MQLEEAAASSHRTTTAEIVERLRSSFDTGTLDELRSEYWVMNENHYEERKKLLELINNQDRILQTLRTQHNNFVIMAKALGEAIINDPKSENVEVLAALLMHLEEDSSSDPSQPVDDPYPGYPGLPKNWPDPTDK